MTATRQYMLFRFKLAGMHIRQRGLPSWATFGDACIAPWNVMPFGRAHPNYQARDGVVREPAPWIDAEGPPRVVATTPHAFIWIRRGIGNRRFGPDFDPRPFQAGVRRRAEEVAATVALALAPHAGDGCLPGLADLVLSAPERFSFVSSYGAEPSVYLWHGYGGGLQTLSELSIRASELQRRLTGFPGSELVRCTGARRGKTTPLHRAVSAAAVHVMRSFHNADRSVQVLGAVTAMEMLGTAGQSDFKALARRIEALVGPVDFERWRGGDTLAARHLFVHKGERVRRTSVANRALGLAMLAAYRAAELTRQLHGLADLHCYLDLLSGTPRPNAVRAAGVNAPRPSHGRRPISLKLLSPL